MGSAVRKTKTAKGANWFKVGGKDGQNSASSMATATTWDACWIYKSRLVMPEHRIKLYDVTQRHYWQAWPPKGRRSAGAAKGREEGGGRCIGTDSHNCRGESYRTDVSRCPSSLKQPKHPPPLPLLKRPGLKFLRRAPCLSAGRGGGNCSTWARGEAGNAVTT